MASPIQPADPEEYLSSCEIIDFHHPQVLKVARDLSSADTLTTIDACFRFVRDEIKHSMDFCLNPATCAASEALQHRTGFCYAKSHLLCALLRANGIPTGMCYQRLTIDGLAPPYCLHGLNAVYLEDGGWYRVDPRGNRQDVQAAFAPPKERLAFTTDLPGEYDLPGVYVEPLPVVVDALRRHRTWEALAGALPDVEGG